MTDNPYWKSTLTPDDLEKGENLKDKPDLDPLPENAYNPDGRYFISYRSVDGRALADDFQVRLRAAGLSAWRDDADLGLGTIKKRLQEALTGTGRFATPGEQQGGGLAGAILIATPHVWTSEPVRHLEAPLILEVHDAHEHDGFQLAVANHIPSASGGPAAMDEAGNVYGIDSDALSKCLMEDVFEEAGLEHIVKHLLEDRVERRLNRLSQGQPFRIDVDSRLPLRSTDKPSTIDSDDDLRVRLHQHPEHRWPAREGLESFAQAMMELKPMISGHGAIQVNGEIHPTIALALGATFSARRRGHVIECLHEREGAVSTWRSDAPAPVTPRTFTSIPVPGGSDIGDKILVMVVASCTPTDRQAFDLLARDPGFRAIHRIELDRWDPITAEEGNDLARRLASELSTLASDGELHLAFVGPWALALLLGHHLSTTNYVSYEWDNVETPGYQPSLRINPGVPRHLTVEMCVKAGRS